MENTATSASTSTRNLKNQDLGNGTASRMEVNATHINSNTTIHTNVEEHIIGMVHLGFINLHQPTRRL